MSVSNRLIGLLCLPLALSATIHGQSFDTTVGGSQVYSAYGLQTEFKWRSLSGWTGLGFSDGVKVGAFVHLPLARGYSLGGGDQMLSGYLDVDEYDSHAFTVRGLSLARETKTESLQIFTGFLSQESEYPFLHMSSTRGGGGLTDTRLIAMLYTHKLSDALRLHAMTLYGSKFTSIESIGWTPSKRWGLAGAAGIGSGAKYFAAKGELHLKRLEAQTSYTVAGQDFHRQDGPYYSSEPLGMNARLALAPLSSIKLLLDHEKTRMYIVSLPSVVGSVNSASLYASFMGFQISPSVSTVNASNLPGQTLTEMFSVSRPISPRWRTFGSYINMTSPNFKQSTFVATNEFKVSSRLAIRQNYNWMNGQNNFSVGGQWLSNRISFSVDQQVYISPLAPAFGAKSVFQAWTFNVRVRTPHGTSTNINTFVTPDGRIQWGGYLSGLRYRAVGSVTEDSPSFSKYVISGLVVDEMGRGVWGIAVQIGAETAISDSDGGFFVHVKNSKPQPLRVLPESSLQTSSWVLTSAPQTTQGFLDGKSSEPARVVVQMSGHFAVKKSEKPASIEPRHETAAISSSSQPHDLQVAMLVEPQLVGDHRISEAQHKTEPIPASDQGRDPQFATHLVTQESTAISIYETQRRTREISVSDQVHNLQMAVETLRSRPAAHMKKRMRIRQPRKTGSVLLVLCRIVSFGLIGRTHKGSAKMSFEEG
jgi:hypothetical protein